MERRQPSYTVGGNVNWNKPLWRTVWKFLKNLKIELTYDPAISLLGIYPEESMIRKDTCAPVFTVALFTIVKTWKQPKYPLIEKSIKKMWYIYTMEGYLAIKNNWNNVICSNLDGPRVSYWVKSDREGEIYDVSYMWDLKKKWYREKIYWAPSFVYWFSCLISSKQRWAHFSIFSF